MADSINRILPTHNFISTVHEDFPKISKKTLFDASVNDARYCTYLPSNTDLSSLTSIEFNIDETTNQYIDLKSILIEVQIELLDGQGVRDNVPGGNVHFVNNLLQTMFPTRHVFFNNTSIEHEYNSAHLSHLQLLLDGTEHVINNKGRTTAAFPLNTFTVAETLSEAYFQRPATVRKMTLSKTNPLHLIGHLNLAISSSNNWLLDRVAMKVVLGLAKPTFCLNTSVAHAAEGFKYKVHSAKLHVMKITPAAGAFLTTTKSLLSGGSMEYLFKRHVTYTQIFPQGQDSIIVNRPFLEKIPNKMYIFLTRQDALNGIYQRDPFYYGHYTLNNYKCIIDGVCLLDRDVDIDSGAIDSYFFSMQNHGFNDTFIAHSLWTQGGLVLCIKTTELDTENMSVERTGNLQFKLRLRDPLAHNVQLYIIGEINSSFNINSDRSIKTNYAY